jgi:chorismate--pyruvate lyase
VELARLNNRSLGSVLFKDPTLYRSPFEIALFTQEMEWHQKVLSSVKRELSTLWARRSLFRIREKPLLLIEVFLPDLLTL